MPFSCEQVNIFKIRDDPRGTRLGRFLRRMSFDESPQCANALKDGIPSYILKRRLEPSLKSMGMFALPVKSDTNESKAFSQIKVATVANLRKRRLAAFHSSHVCSAWPVISAKPIFGAATE